MYSFAMTCMRIIFGAWFLYAGIEYFLPFDLQPLGEQPLARQFTLTLIDSGLFAWIKAAEVVMGVLILINRAMPLTLAAALPLSVVIFYWNLVLEGGVVEWVFGIAAMVLNLALLHPYRAVFRPLFIWRHQPA